MAQINFMLVSDEESGDKFITVFVPGAGEPKTASTQSHANFDEILDAAINGDPDVIDLFDLAEQASKHFEALSDRVKISGGRVFLDGDEIDNALTRQVVRFIEEGVEDWKPLVAFFENVLANPNEHSREQLFEWLNRRDFTITQDGQIVGYKGVRRDATGVLRSINAGPGIVNGQSVNGHLDNSEGNVVEIARSYVQHDPSIGCHTGLHVGTFDYANGFGSTVLKVVVNPRDVVSVPTDCDAAKVRCCRYKVVNVVTERLTAAVDAYSDEDDWGDEDSCEDCGEDFLDCDCDC